MIQAKIRLKRPSARGALVLVQPPGEGPPSWPEATPEEVAAATKPTDALQLGPDVQALPRPGGGHLLLLAVQADPEAPESEWSRRAGARLARAMAAAGIAKASLVRAEGDFDLETFAEGFLLARYHFGDYLAAPGPELELEVAPRKGSGDKKALAAAAAIVEDVALCRDLVNRPSEDLDPDTLAAAAKAEAKRAGMTCKVYRGKGFEKAFPAIHAVGKASIHKPCLIRLDYKPKGKKLPYVVLCGKGITYDSGGYHIKPIQSMFLMKKDMGGAATVLAATAAAARLKLPVRVTTLLATAENMVGPDAFKPGDVIGSRSGKTIEIRSTDAEGRLVLADALTYATELKPDVIIDLATLTGVAARFLGDAMSPLMGTDAEVVEELTEAGAATHERLLHVPLIREFREATKGVISDVRNWGNVGGHGAGTMVAGGFLRHFVDDVPWAHIDMSNTSWANADRDHLTTGATAFGVRMLVEYLARRAAKG